MKTRSDRYEIKQSEPIKETKPEIKHSNSFKKTIKSFIFKIIILIILVFVYGSFIETKIIKINTYNLKDNIPDNFNNLKIIHISDIHYGTTINQKELNTIINKINKLNPDIVLFTGDLIDKSIFVNDSIKKELINSLSKIKVKLYKYSILGDEDKPEIYEEIMSNSNFITLNNEAKLLYYKGETPILIAGFSPINSKPNYEILANEAYQNLYKIIIFHEPDSYESIKNYNCNLVLSGHNLGGIIKIPFTNKKIINKENAVIYNNSYYKINNTKLYISNGLGGNNNFRLNNYPSINLYRITK